MYKNFSVLLVLSFVCIGCSTLSTGPKYNTAQDIVFKTDCLKYGGKIQEYPDQGLCKCTIGVNEIYNTQSGYRTVSNYSSKYDKDGYDKQGFNYLGYDKDGYNELKFNKNGVNRQGVLFKEYFKELCLDKAILIIPNGCIIDGKKFENGDIKSAKILLTYPSRFNQEGYDKNGYDKEGYNKSGFNENGFFRDGYNRNGFNAQGVNKDTLTKYDKNGKNKDGLTQQEQMQKDFYEKMLALEKEKIELEKQKLQLEQKNTQAAQRRASAAEEANSQAALNSLNQSIQNMNNQLNYNNQQMLNRDNVYKVKPVGPFGY